MPNYLGEFPVNREDTFLHTMTPSEIALYYIFVYGQIDGEHHKAWVLDQVVRILNGAPIVDLREARWDDGNTEIRFSIGTCEQYQNWVLQYQQPDDAGEPEYTYNTGVAP